MKIRRAFSFVILLTLVGTIMVACNGQEKSTNSPQNSGSTTASSDISVSNQLGGREVREAVTEEDFNILKGGSEFGKIIKGGQEMLRKGESFANEEEESKNVIRMGNKLGGRQNEIFPEYGYYEKDNLGNVYKTIYYPISGLSIFEKYGRLVGSYGDIPVPVIDRSVDSIVALTKQNLVAYKCSLVGCSIGWVVDKNAIWNQNELIPVNSPKDLEITDLNGQPRSNPMDWEIGEELLINCDGQNHQAHADSYIYSISDQKTELAVETTKVERNGRNGKISTYDISKLEPGLYYFQDQGIYKVI